MVQDYGRGGGPVSTGSKAAAKGAAAATVAIVSGTARTIAAIKRTSKR